jgi:hypothetical protein
MIGKIKKSRRTKVKMIPRVPREEKEGYRFILAPK